MNELRGQARRVHELRERVYDAIEAIYECDSDDDHAWDAAWVQLRRAVSAWIGSNPMPRRTKSVPTVQTG
jgi:hypothetical protein